MNQFSGTQHYRLNLEDQARRLKRKRAILMMTGAPIAGLLVIAGAPFMVAGWLSGKALDLLQLVASRTAHPLLRGANAARAEAFEIQTALAPVQWNEGEAEGEIEYGHHDDPRIVAEEMPGADLMGADWGNEDYDPQYDQNGQGEGFQGSYTPQPEYAYQR